MLHFAYNISRKFSRRNLFLKDVSA